MAVLQAADVLIEALRLPAWSLTLTAVLALVGLPIVVVLAWVYELTPEGSRRQDSVEAGSRRMSAATWTARSPCCRSRT